MDPLKLLTRGTKLSKKSTEVDSLRLPSAGTKPAPISQTQGASEDKAQENRGVKRKRFVEKSLVKDDVPDFFATNGNGTQEDQVIELDMADISDSEALQRMPALRTEEECKKILKSNKLKINLMVRQDSSPKKQFSLAKKPNLIQLVSQPLESFGDLRARYNVSRRLADNLRAQGFQNSTEVQLGAIPLLLGSDEERGLSMVSKRKNGGKSHIDLLSIAPTGSGKTLAFLIPIIQGILDLRHGRQESEAHAGYTKAIILAPTHELVDQIVNEARKLVFGTSLKVTSLRKGMRVLQEEQDYIDNSDEEPTVKADILVSTPLLLVHALSTSESETRKVLSIRYLVLDEADVLLDPLFRSQSLAIWNSLDNPALQVSLWSATIGSSIESLVQTVMTERLKRLGLHQKHRYLIRIIAGLKDAALPTVSHKLIYAANEQGKLLAIRQILHPSTSADLIISSLRPPFLVFTQTVERATALYSELLYDIPIEAGGSSRIAVLHSSLPDNKRHDIMAGFRKGEIWVLITTDLLSRGVDFRGVNGIVNYDIPNTSAAYVHRAGRTGRAGRQGGVAVTLYTKEDIPYVKNVANVIAASEKAHGKQDGEGIPKWLLDALPAVSKKTKKELRKRGVAARRSGPEGSRAVRISTKSGFERREQNKRKGAISASRARKALKNQVDDAGSESEWSGLD
jgi:ATP-dependent RNA helicase DDX52/ROK1